MPFLEVAMANMRVVFGFDMETDVGSWTPFYEGFVHGTPVILDLLKKHGITATFFFTGDGAKKHPRIAASVRAAGHEIGCHTLFHETVGDSLFDIPGVTPILPEEVEHRLDLATQWVEEATGVRPISFRAPRLFGSTTMVNALESLGYVADASYPLYYFEKQLAPYHPSRADWTQTGDLKILELPNVADMSIESKDPYGRDRDQWPLFRTGDEGELMRHIDGFAGYCAKSGRDVFLCFYFHPWEFHPMPQGEIHYGEGAVHPDNFIVKNCGPVATQRFDKLIQDLLKRGAKFFQARQIAEQGA